MFEIPTVVKACLLLATAILGGETYHEAGADYFVAACYLEGFEWEDCIEWKNEGLANNAFPVYID